MNYCDVDIRVWRARKKEFYNRMREDREIGYLDQGIETLLEKIFSIQGLFTTSSCTGRISLLEGEWPWERDDTRVLFKRHGFVGFKEIKRVLEDLGNIDNVWLHVMGPILHVSAADLAIANKFLEVARESGFKHSGIISCSRKGISIEIMSGIQMSAPIKRNGEQLVSDTVLSSMIDIANDMLKEGWKRLRRLEVNIEAKLLLT